MNEPSQALPSRRSPSRLREKNLPHSGIVVCGRSEPGRKWQLHAQFGKQVKPLCHLGEKA